MGRSGPSLGGLKGTTGPQGRGAKALGASSAQHGLCPELSIILPQLRMRIARTLVSELPAEENVKRKIN